ncbi:MAG: low molecular weight phosphatase family protein [Clostridia bacterium]
MKVLFICTGNTSRSPMAEGLFRQMIKGTVLEGNAVCMSAGLSSTNGENIAENAVIALEEIGVDISDYKSRRFSSKEISMWDCYFSMGDTHSYILEKAGIPHDKIYTPKEGIIDPYGLEVEDYRVCREQLINELKSFIEKLCIYYENRRNA